MADLRERVVTAAVLLLVFTSILFGVFIPMYGVLLIGVLGFETLRSARISPLGSRATGDWLHKAILCTIALEAFILLSSILLYFLPGHPYSARSWSPPVLLFFHGDELPYAGDMGGRLSLLLSLPYLWLIIGYLLIKRAFLPLNYMTALRFLWMGVGCIPVAYLFYQSMMYPMLRIASAFYWFDKAIIFVLAIVAWEWWRLIFYTASPSTAKKNLFVPGIMATIGLVVILLSLDFLITANKLLYVGFLLQSTFVILAWIVLGCILLLKRSVFQSHAMKWVLVLFVPNALIAVYRAISIGITAPPFLYILGIFALVWVADIGAYFCGRRFGKHKLAVHISPGKTWEGALGAVVLCMVFGGLMSLITESYYNEVVLRVGYIGLFVWIFFLVAASILGDLFESQLKRQSGYKDSSNILPGHGGFYDRMDAMLPVLPLAIVMLESNFFARDELYRLFNYLQMLLNYLFHGVE